MWRKDSRDRLSVVGEVSEASCAEVSVPIPINCGCLDRASAAAVLSQRSESSNAEDVVCADTGDVEHLVI